MTAGRPGRAPIGRARSSIGRAGQLLSCLAPLLAGCAPSPERPPVVAELVPRLHLESPACASIQLGGYGSALAVGRDGSTFYLLTDRGPNVDWPGEGQKLFPLPGFTPQIGVFRRAGHRLERTGVVLLRDSVGRPLSGLPNPPGAGGTGERPYGPGGRPLPWDSTGLDPEGLVALDDGTFWIADEYGPHLVHLDSTGRTLERVNPFGSGRRLPRVLARRRPNRGLEGLAILPAESTLVGIMQSPLDNPRVAGRKSAVVRLVAFHVPSGRSRQYLYPLDDPSYVASDITALPSGRLLVLEQDTRFPAPSGESSRQKRVYEVDLARASDVSDPADGPAGLLVGGKTLAQLAGPELRAAGVRPVDKRMLLDLLDPALGYAHDKAEGIARLPDGTLAVSNDDDFGIESDGRGGCLPKRNPATGAVDRSRIFFLSPPRTGD